MTTPPSPCSANSSSEALAKEEASQDKLAERLEEIARSNEGFVHILAILRRLAKPDEKVAEAAALTRCAMPDQVNVCETACAACLDEARAALTAALSAAMEENNG